MDPIILQSIGIFFAGFVAGIIVFLLFNKLRSGSASAMGVKNEYDEYKGQVEAHFEETSKKFKEMTEQYQDLYQHLAVGATSLCRPESAAASLVGASQDAPKLEKQEAPETSDSSSDTPIEQDMQPDSKEAADTEEQSSSPEITDEQRKAAEKKVAAKLAAEEKAAAQKSSDEKGESDSADNKKD